MRGSDASSIFRSDPDDHVEFCGQLTHLASRKGFEGDLEKGTEFLGGSIEEEVIGVQLVPKDVTLGRQDPLVFQGDCNMDVGGTPGVGSWLDAAEVVFPIQAGEEPSVALEVGIEFSVSTAS